MPRHAALIVGLLLAGCGSDGGTFASYRGFTVTSYEDLCEARFRCCTLAEALIPVPHESDAESCAETLTEGLVANTRYQKVVTAILSSQMDYDAAVAERCRDANMRLMQMCEDKFEPNGQGLIAACAGMLTGMIKEGAKCDLEVPEACVTGTTCNPTTRTCKLVARSGQTCAPTDICEKGTSCLPTGVCGAPQIDGAACSSSDNCIGSRCVGGVCSTATVHAHLCPPQ